MSSRDIVLLSPNFAPETGAAAQRVTALAEELSRAGHTVTVITHLPNYPQNTIYDGYDVSSPMLDTHGDTIVVRLRPWIVPQHNLPLRLLAESLFCVQAAFQTLRRKPALLVASSPYMFLGPVGLAVSRLIGAKYIWDVRDLTWLYPRVTGKRTYGLDRPLEMLMKWTGGKVDGLTTATDGLLRYFENRPPYAYAVPNGVRDEWLDELLQLEPPQTKPRPVITYAGLFGYNHGLSTVVEAAALLPEYDFVLAGDGPERDALEDRADELGLENLEFTGYLKPAQIVQQYRRADVLVSHVRRNPLFRSTQPAKMVEYMATGRPVVLAGEGEAVEIVEQNQLGFTTAPEDPAALADAIRRAVVERETVQRNTEFAREFVDRHRRRSILNQRFLTLISNLLERR